MDILNLKLEARQVATLADIDPAKMQLWLNRNLIVGQLEPIEGGGSRGIRRKFSFFNLMDIAIARALVDAGLAPKSAFQISQYFAHTGGDRTETSPERHPSLPFHQSHGDTILATSLGRHWIGTVDEKSGGGIQAMFFHLSLARTERPVESAAIVNTSAIFSQVCEGLSLHPYKVLDEIYGDDPEQRHQSHKTNSDL